MVAGDERERLAGVDWAAAAAVALGIAVLARIAFQERFANDGPVLAGLFALEPGAFHWQIAYLPLGRAVRALLRGAGDPFEALRLLQAAAAGAGTGASLLLARALGAGRGAALAAALLVALSPYALFFATSVEVHSLAFGGVAMAAAATVLGPWRRAPRLALGLAALFYASLFLLHRTEPFAGLGFLGLVAVARRRAGRPLAPRRLLLGVGPLLLASALLVVLVADRWWTSRTGASETLDLDLVAQYRGTSSRAAWVWEGWVRPLALLLPLAAGGAIVWWRRDRAVALALLGGSLPPLAFFAWWGVPEDGGYLLGQGSFHAALAAAALAELGRRSALAAPALVLAQAGIAWWGIRSFDQDLRPRDRVELVRSELGEEAVLAKIGWLAPDVRVWLPDVQVLDMTETLFDARRAGVPPEVLARTWAADAELLLAERPVGLDVTWSRVRWDLAGEETIAYVRDFQRALLDLLPHRRVRAGGWTLVVLEPAG